MKCLVIVLPVSPYIISNLPGNVIMKCLVIVLPVSPKGTRVKVQ